MLQNTRGLSKFLLTILKAKFPQIDWLLYPNDLKLMALKKPIGNIELQSFDITPKIITDLNTVECTFVIRLLFNDSAKAQLNIRDAALAISTFLNKSNLANQQIETIEVISNQQDFFALEVDGYISWEILAMVRFFCGDSIYELNNTTPDVDIDIDNNLI